MLKTIRNIWVPMALCISVIGLLVIGCSDSVEPPAPTPITQSYGIDELRYNEVSFKQTHNSYIEFKGDSQEPWCGDACFGACNNPIDTWRNMALEEQMNFRTARPWQGGVGGIELDLKVDVPRLDQEEWRWCVRHRRQYTSSADLQFSKYLERLNAWSTANPDHDVIHVMLELKWLGYKEVGGPITDGCAYNEITGDGLPDNPPTAQDDIDYRAGFTEKFDAYLSKYFDRQRIFTPGDLFAFGGGADLASAASNGWPKLKELKGKFIFLISDGHAGPIPYAETQPSERLCFQRGNGEIDLPPSGNRLFWEINNGNSINDMYAQALAREPALILRCWPGGEDNEDTETNFARALANGVNIVGTDQATDHSWASSGTSRFFPQSTSFWEPTEENASNHNQSVASSDLAAATYGGKIYVAYDNNFALKYFTYDGKSWPSEQSISGGSTGKPSLVVFDNKLCMVTNGPNYSNQVLWRTFSESTGWSSPEVVANGKGNKYPCLTLFDGSVYLFYVGVDNRITYKTFSGGKWSTSEITPESEGATPVACEHEGKLYVFYKREGSRDLSMMAFDGNNWTTPRNVSAINSANTDSPPTVVPDGEFMHVIFRAGSDLWSFKVWGDGIFSGQHKIENGRTSRSVGGAKLGNDLVMFYKGENNNDVYIQSMKLDY